MTGLTSSLLAKRLPQGREKLLSPPSVHPHEAAPDVLIDLEESNARSREMASNAAGSDSEKRVMRVSAGETGRPEGQSGTHKVTELKSPRPEGCTSEPFTRKTKSRVELNMLSSRACSEQQAGTTEAAARMSIFATRSLKVGATKIFKMSFWHLPAS